MKIVRLPRIVGRPGRIERTVWRDGRDPVARAGSIVARLLLCNCLWASWPRLALERARDGRARDNKLCEYVEILRVIIFVAFSVL